MSMEGELKDEFLKFQQEVAKDGEDIVFRVFPTKIIELNKLLRSMDDPTSPFHRSHASTSTDAAVYPPPAESPNDVTSAKKRKLAEGELPVVQANDFLHPRYPELVKGNTLLTQTLHKRLKEECETLTKLTDQVKLWVAMTMPRIEDGDNFGVGVQEEVLSELHRAQEAGINLRDVPRQSYLTRAKICSKLIKYPNVEDYTTALKEHDDKQFFLARQNILDIRNVYATMTDMIHKNISKIRKPKGENSMNLY